MDLKGKIRKTLRESYGDFSTNLEGEYRDVITEALLYEDISNKKEWVTYNQVILELKHNIKDNLLVRELLYSLTDNEVKEVKKRTPELERLYYKIMNF
jgi:hypothetical protein